MLEALGARITPLCQIRLGVQAHEEAERFNPGWLEDEGERVVLEALGARITPLCRQPGRVVLTPARLYFQPFNVVSAQPTQVFQLDQARPYHGRMYVLGLTGSAHPARAGLPAGPGAAKHIVVFGGTRSRPRVYCERLAIPGRSFSWTRRGHAHHCSTQVSAAYFFKCCH